MSTALAGHGDVPADPPATGIVDADVHPTPRSRDVLKQHMAKRMHPYFDQLPGRQTNMPATIGARQMRTTFREDTFPPGGGPPGSDPAFLAEQLLNRYGVTYAVLDPLEQIGVAGHGELGSAIASATNDWLSDEWLEHDERFLGSIVVPAEDAPRAVREIERLADDRRFVQVLLLLPFCEPPGHSKYRPIYAAAAEAGLPVAFHPGGFSGCWTGTGTPTYFFELHVGLPFSYSAAVVSLVESGVLTENPTLRLILQEGAISWMVPLMARLDRAAQMFQQHVPHISEPPSTTIRRHFWFTTQPIEEPRRAVDLRRVFDALDMNDRIMFASDYPHWDFDAPDRSLPSSLPSSLRSDILSDNAAALYGLDVAPS